MEWEGRGRMMPRLSDDDNELALRRRCRGRGDETESGYQTINTES